MTLLPTVEVPATPHWGTCYSPRPSLPGTGCRQPPLGTGDPCSSLWEALIDEVYLVSSYKAALRGRRRGWPEARPLPSFRLLDCSLQGPPRFAVVLIQSSHRGFVLPPPTAGSGVSVPSTDARLTETSDPLGPPVTAPARRGAPERGIHESQMACKSRLSRVSPLSAGSVATPTRGPEERSVWVPH